MTQVMLFVQLSSPALQFVKAGHIRSCLCEIFPKSRLGPHSWPHWFKGRIQQLLCKVLHKIPCQRLAQVQLEGCGKWELKVSWFHCQIITYKEPSRSSKLRPYYVVFQDHSIAAAFAEPDSSNYYFERRDSNVRFNWKWSCLTISSSSAWRTKSMTLWG